MGFLSFSVIRIQNVIIFNAFKRRMTRVTIQLDSQELLTEQGQEVRVGRAAKRAGNLHFCLGLLFVLVSLLLHGDAPSEGRSSLTLLGGHGPPCDGIPALPGK